MFHVSAQGGRADETKKRKKTDMNDYTYEENVEAVKKFLDDDDWHYETKSLDSVTAFQGTVGGFEGLYSSFAFRLVVRGDDVVVSDAVFPASGAGKIPEISEFIVRANHGFKYGAFDLDPSDGEITFHMSLPADTIHVDSEWVPALILIPLKTLAKYAKGFTSVLMGIKSPEEAVADCEREMKSDDEE